MEATQKVLNVFSESANPLKAEEIVDRTGLDRKQVDKVLKELKSENRIFSPKRCFWDIKK